MFQIVISGIVNVDSFHFQIICWVLGEYGTADGKYSASYIIGKLCDFAGAPSALVDLDGNHGSPCFEFFI